MATEASHLRIFPIVALRRATNDFAAENIVGRGGFSIVYRGELAGVQVAVKKLNTAAPGTALIRELQILSSVQSERLVRIL